MINTLLNALIDPALIVDMERRLIAANPSAVDQFNIKGFGGDLALSVRHPNVLDAVKLVHSGQAIATTTITHETPIFQAFEVHISLLDQTEVDQPYLLAQFRDVTEWRQADRMRKDFVANVSHELRSPLSTLIGFIETLKGSARDDSAAQERFLDIMDRESQRMARLVDDLLSLSRVEAGKHIAPSGKADLNTIFQTLIPSIEKAATSKEMAIDLDLSADLPAIIGDENELLQVFRNLTDNAINYGRPGTDIRIQARREARIPDIGASGVSIAITNRGEVIEAMHLPRLTERFYRIDKGRSRDAGGTGLGLAIVKHIVTRHNGRLKVESDEVEGTTFTVFLPALS